MNIDPRPFLRLLVLLSIAGVLAACASSTGPGWTYAPLGPTQSPGGSPGQSPAGSPGQSPGGSPGTGTTFDVSTPQEDPLAFVPAELTMPAGAQVTVNYLNDSNLPHNIEFFAGSDQTAESLGATPTVTGPGALESVTFTAPAEPGEYYFWCVVHQQTMDGTYRVE